MLGYKNIKSVHTKDLKSPKLSVSTFMSPPILHIVYIYKSWLKNTHGKRKKCLVWKFQDQFQILMRMLSNSKKLLKVSLFFSWLFQYIQIPLWMDFVYAICSFLDWSVDYYFSLLFLSFVLVLGGVFVIWRICYNIVSKCTLIIDCTHCF